MTISWWDLKKNVKLFSTEEPDKPIVGSVIHADRRSLKVVMVEGEGDGYRAYVEPS